MKNNQSLSFLMHKNIILNYLFRGLGIVLGLYSTKLNLEFLGNSLFGIWATIASISAWINYGDFGIGNGLRNKLAEAFAANDDKQQKSVIFTGMSLLFFLSVILFLAITLITEIIFYFEILSSEYRSAMYVTNIFFCADLFLGMGRSIAYGIQKSWLTSFVQVLTVSLRILILLILIKFNSLQSKLLIFSVLNGGVGSIANIILLFIIFCNLGKNFFHRIWTYYDSSLKRSIVSLGLKFFVLQISCLVLYSSDNLIINRLIDSESVTKYELITKIFNTGDMLFSILLVSLWSAVTYAATKNDFEWIKIQINKFLIFLLLYSFGVIIVAFLFNLFIKFWLGNNAIYYESNLIVLFSVFAIANAFGAIFVNITNGLGRLKLQMSFSIVGAILNIPLSIFFADYMKLGIFGIKLATLICCIGSMVFVPIDICLFLKKKLRME